MSDDQDGCEWVNVFFWYRPTRVVPDQRPLNGRCCCCKRLLYSGGVDQCGVNSLPLNLWQYMTDCCIATSDTARCWHLQSASCHQLFIQRHRRSTFGRQAFSVAGLAAWNSLPGYLRDLSRSFDSFHYNLKLAPHTWNKIILVNMQSFLPFSPTNGSDQVKTSMKFGSQ